MITEILEILGLIGSLSNKKIEKLNISDSGDKK